jgi:hypothetical protein
MVTLAREKHDVPSSTSATPAVDTTDWLKTAAIIFVSIDHFGYFFVEDEGWWTTFARLGAPPFFFLVGYAESRTVPLYWIWLGVILTVLDSWNADWTWVAPNILLSFALIRIARPYVNSLVRHYGWAAFAFLVVALLVVVPPAEKLVDYGAEGWLWALFGLFQRQHGSGDRLPAPAKLESGHRPIWMTENPRLMRLLACIVAAVVYFWQEQKEFTFPPIQFTVFILEIGVLSVGLCLFMRGPSRIQPPEPIAAVLRFIGRHTLEIYAIQLAASELLVKFMPDLAP